MRSKTMFRSALLFAVVVPLGCSGQKAAESPKTDKMDHSSMTPEQHMAMHGSGDSSFARMQQRGQMAMGVDQYMSSHKFDITSDGGRIELQSDKDDSLAVAQIRAHMKLIQHAFAAGDFSTPAFVHARGMPGTDVMARKAAAIKYTYGDLPRGGEVRITTSDAEAKAAITQFLEAQRKEHRASGSNSAH
ncbi:MAG TPA: hypothetical protein VKO87_01275 [Gemmatimonadaceae bacterium]|nr:hypothetical protein [Gemmatimonadaceae bacterium]